MNNGCIFCKIANRKIKTSVVYEDDEIIAFDDINPQAPVHLLFISKKHIETINDLSVDEAGVIGRIYFAIKNIAEEKNIGRSGYRIVANCNKDAGQEVFHLHFHVLGGRKFSWPPG